jgi:hypothetical protein
MHYYNRRETKKNRGRSIIKKQATKGEFGWSKRRDNNNSSTTTISKEDFQQKNTNITILASYSSSMHYNK